MRGCNDDSTPCQVPLGDYHIALPDSVENPPALIFLHGAGGKGESATRMQTVLDRGYAVIGPQGLKRPGSRFGASWSFHPEREEIRDELAFIREIIDDAVDSHGIDRENVLIGGFSIGGSMTSYLACDAPNLAKGFAPVAGGFWRPHPEMGTCAGPVNLLHTHGWRDKTVPLEGRPLGNGSIFQGDIFVTLQIWRDANGCDGLRADSFDTDGPFWRRKWETCSAGRIGICAASGGAWYPAWVVRNGARLV